MCVDDSQCTFKMYRPKPIKKAYSTGIIFQLNYQMHKLKN